MQNVFSAAASVQAMLDFEAALARAEAASGVIPASAARRIAAKCRVALFDLQALSRDSRQAGNIAIPLVKQLTALVARDSAAAARYVHWAATSQDAIDTGLELQVRRALAVIDAQLLQLGATLAKLSAAHSTTLMAGRTWAQQALPVPLGLKTAAALSAVTRHRRRLGTLRAEMAVLQFGGAAGTLASLGEGGLDVSAALGRELDLVVPALPWHSQRDRIAETGATLGLVVGTLGKLARDVSLLMQTEVGEAFEPAAQGKGGSSTMPHKRNPVGCALVLSAALRVPALVSTLLSAMLQEHERGLGGWHAEWETLPEIFNLASGALEHMNELLAGLEVRPDQMKRNLEATRGLLLAEAVSMELGRHIGRVAAHALLEEACRRAVREDRHLRDVVLEHATVRKYLAPAAIRRLFEPARYTGVARPFIRRAIAEWRADLRNNASGAEKQAAGGRKVKTR